MWYFADPLHIGLPRVTPAPETEEMPMRTSTGSRLSDYGVPSHTQGIKINVE